MNCRIRNLLLLLAIATVSAGKTRELETSPLQRHRSLEGTPTHSPIVPPKKEHHEDKPKPAPKSANHPPAPKTNVNKPAPKPKSSPAPPAPAPSSNSSGGSHAGSSSASSAVSSSSSNGGKHSVGHHSGPSPNIKDKSSSHGGAKKPLLLLIGAAASTLIIAGYTRAKRRAPVIREHPLKGSLGRRMKMFGDLAGKKNRRGSLDGTLEDEMGYKSADDHGITIV